jgi:hypothetical protein
VDKTFWRSVAENDGALPDGYTIAALTPELLESLGSTDAELRDDLAYPILDTWIHTGGYTHDELRTLLAQLGQNLSVGLGEPAGDKVFLRTFSILVANEILEEDNLQPFLAEAEVRAWLGRALAYLAGERDLRGYIAGQGWAHSAAHTADTLWVFTRNRYLGAPDLERILDAIAAKVIAPVEHVFLYREDQRLAAVVISALQRDLLEMPFLAAWLGGMAQPADRAPWREAYQSLEQISAFYNTLAFLRSVYFQLLLGGRVPAYHPDPDYFRRLPAVRDDLLPAIAEALRASDPAFYARPA